MDYRALDPNCSKDLKASPFLKARDVPEVFRDVLYEPNFVDKYMGNEAYYLALSWRFRIF